MGGAPVGGQLALDRLLQDRLLELGEEGLLAGDFAGFSSRRVSQSLVRALSCKVSNWVSFIPCTGRIVRARIRCFVPAAKGR